MIAVACHIYSIGVPAIVAAIFAYATVFGTGDDSMDACVSSSQLRMCGFIFGSSAVAGVVAWMS